MHLSAFSFELRRKAFHSYGIIVPLLYLLMPKSSMVLALFLLTAFVLCVDISRHYNCKIKALTDKIFAKLMRKKEQSGSYNLSGASFMISGFFLTSLFFSKELAITGWFILIISDSAASLIGVKIGTIKINGKSLEGSMAFFSSAIFISIFCYCYIKYNASFLTILISCFVTAMAELYSAKINIDDNLLIPITYCMSISLLNLII